MDNRWRFLYCVITELRGHGKRMWAGKGKTGASGEGGDRKNRLIIQSRDAERMKVVKHRSLPSRKAAIACNAPVP